MSMAPLRLLLFASCASILLAPDAAIAEGLLDEVRRAARTRDSSHDDDDDDGHQWNWDCEDDEEDDGWGELFYAPIRFTVSAPYWLPHFALEDNWSTWPEFPAGPYADGTPGYLVIDSQAEGPTAGWSLRETFLYGTDFGDLSWSGTRIVLDTASRFGFDTSWNRWVEQRPGRDDSLMTGDFNVVVRFAQSEQLQFHSGLGVNWLADHGSGEAGFNFTYGFDWLPQRPWVVSASLDAGTLGHASFYHGQFSVGAVWRRVELFTGYDATWIGGATLDGVIGGVRFWF